MSSSIENNVEMSVTILLLKTLENATKEYARECVRRCASQYGFDSDEALANLHLENLAIQVREMKKRSNGKKKVTEKKEKVVKVAKAYKASIPLPFVRSMVSEDGCQGLAYNGGLFTQCPKMRMSESSYCKGCQMEADNNASGAPSNGTVTERCACDMMSFRDSKGRSPIAYSKIMDKQKLTREQVESEAGKLNIVIDESHFVVVEKKTATKTVTKKATKKTVTVVESAAVEDLFAQLVEEDSEDESVTVVMSESDEDTVSVVDTKDLEKGERNMMKEADSESKKAEKAIKIAEKKQEQEAQRIAAKEQKIADELAAKAAREQKLIDDKLAREQKLIDDKLAREQKLIDDKLAKEQKIADEKAAKEQKLIDDKLAKEAKIAADLAAKEQKKIDDKLAKEAKIAADLAAKEQKKIDEQAAKEAKIAADLAAKEKKIADDLAAKAAKEQKRLDDIAAKEQKRLDDIAAKEKKIADDLAAKEAKKLQLEAEKAEKEAKKLEAEQKKAAKAEPKKATKEGTRSIVATKANFNVGDKVEYRTSKGEVSKGTVTEVKMGKSFVEYDLQMEDGSCMSNAAEGNIMAAKVEAVAAAAPKKVTVKRITIDGKQYLKTAENLLYDPETKEEMGIYDPETNTIKALPDDSEDEVEEDGYTSE